MGKQQFKKNIMNIELKQAQYQFTNNTLDNYKLYQIENDQNLKTSDHILYWFTIKLISPTGRWDHFQLDLKKYVCPFYYDLCEELVGKRWKRNNQKHLKPLLFAAPDYENSNIQGPLTVNAFNHIHGLISIRNDQKHILQMLLRETRNKSVYGNNFDKIREITIKEANHITTDNAGYKIYINKNADRKSGNINNGMFLPADQNFHKFIARENQPF